MDRKTLEQNYQKSFGASPAAELEQNYQRSGIDSLVQSVKKATQYNPSSPARSLPRLRLLGLLLVSRAMP